MIELETSQIITLTGLFLGQAAFFGALLYRLGARNAVLEHRITQLEEDRDDYVIAAVLVPQMAEHARSIDEARSACRELAKSLTDVHHAVDRMHGAIHPNHQKP